MTPPSALSAVPRALRTAQASSAELPSTSSTRLKSTDIALRLVNSFKLASTQSPPSLYSPSGRSPSVESTPVSTPVSTAGYPLPPRRSREDDLFFTWHKKAAVHATAADDFTSDDVLFPPDDDDEDSHLPLFPAADPIREMPSSSSPIEIATSRQNSSSPRTQTSNLTSQLQHDTTQRNGTMAAPSTNGNADFKARQESVGMLGTTPYGARQIPVAGGRRESYNMSNSLVGGMSWGGLSMGSFIKDE